MKRKLLPIYFGLALALGFCACQTGTDSENTTESELTGDSGYDAITSAIEAEPKNPELYYQRAKLSFEIEDYKSAIGDLARALAIDSANLEYHYLLSDVYLQNFQSQLALSTMQRAAELDPEGPTTLIKLAELQLILKQYDDVYRTLGKVMEQDPQNTEALFLLGIAYQEQGNQKRAVQTFQTITEIDSRNTDAWIMLGKLYQAENDPLANQCFDNAIRIDSSKLEAWHAKAYYLQSKDDIPGALDIYMKIHQLDSQYPEAYLNAGILYLELDSTALAKEEFHKLSKVDPANPLSYYYLGVIAEANGETGKAMHQYRQAYQLAPDFQRAKNAIERLRDSGQGEM